MVAEGDSLFEPPSGDGGVQRGRDKSEIDYTLPYSPAIINKTCEASSIAEGKIKER